MLEVSLLNCTQNNIDHENFLWTVYGLGNGLGDRWIVVRLPEGTDWLRRLLDLLLNGYQGIIRREKSDRCVELNISFQSNVEFKNEWRHNSAPPLLTSRAQGEVCLHFKKRRCTAAYIPLKEMVKTGGAAGMETYLKDRWWESKEKCSSAFGRVWTTLLTYPLREDMNEPSDIFRGANVMKFSYEKPYATYKEQTHLMWLTQWSVRDLSFKCLLSFRFATGTETELGKQRSPKYARPATLLRSCEEWKLKRQSVKTVCKTSAEEMLCLTWLGREAAVGSETRFEITLECNLWSYLTAVDLRVRKEFW